MTPEKGSGGQRCFQFGPFELDQDAFELRRDGSVLRVEPQSLRLLSYLIENRARAVPREELITEIWRREAVTDWAVSAAIRALRRVLNDTSTEKRFVRTVHGHGFRFIGEINPTRPTSDLHTAAKPVLLILPFDLRGIEQSSAYLADGLTDDLILDLSHSQGIEVLSREASRALASNQTSPERAELGVTHILSGDLRPAEDQVLVSVGLSDVGRARQIWGHRQSFSRRALLDGQGELAAQVLSALAPESTELAQSARGTENPLAYDAYLKGRFEYYLYSPAHFVRALEQFELAARIDNGFGDALAQQSYCRTALHVFGWPGADASLSDAEELARRAIALDPHSALGHARLGWVLGYLDRSDETQASFRRAVAIAPENAEVHYAYGETLNRLGQPKHALEILDLAFSLERFFPHSWEFGKAHSQVLLRNHAMAATLLRSVLGRVPGFVPARVQLVRTLAESGEVDAARKEQVALKNVAPRYSLAAAARMFPYPQEGERIRLASALSRAGLE